MIKVLTQRERLILYATISAIVFALGFNFLIMPIWAKNNNLNKEITFTRTRLKKYLQLLSQKDYIQSKYSKFYASFKLSERKENTLSNILSELESLAKNANIKIIDIRPQATGLLIELRTEGTMEGYLSFIYNLENSLSLLRIKRFQLTAKPNTLLLEAAFSVFQLSSE